MTPRACDFVAQNVVCWHPGCSGGAAWIQWGLTAIDDYRKTRSGEEANAVAELAERLWADPLNKKCKTLAAPSPAGRELFRCAIHYIAQRRNWHLAEPNHRAQFEALPREAIVWARQVTELVEAVYELSENVVGFIRDAAATRNLRLPARLVLDDPADLVDAVESVLGLEHAINIGMWPRIAGSSFGEAEATEILQIALRIGRRPGSRSGKAVASAILSRGFNHRACDGFELELSEFNIIHIPHSTSPRRQCIRDRMIQIIEESWNCPAPATLPDQHPNESTDDWASRAVEALKSEPESARIARRYPDTAAHVLIGIGDDAAIASIRDWFRRDAAKASELFRDDLFEYCGYEIGPDGRRRELFLDFSAAFVGGPPPLSGARRDRVEIFRPATGRCDECGRLLLAIFDVADPTIVRAFGSTSARMVLPFCPNCCEGKDGYDSSLRFPAASDSDDDAWPVQESDAAHLASSLRRFVAGAGDSRSATNEAWLGGAPAWEQYPRWPWCRGCRRRMIFAGQVRAGASYYAFFCPSCWTSNVRTQYD